MKTILPLNTTPDGCAFTIVTRYEARCYLECMTRGGSYYPATGVIEIEEDERGNRVREYSQDGQLE